MVDNLNLISSLLSYVMKWRYSYLNDEEYARKRYKLIFGKELDLKTPVSFNEKIQWLKLFNRDEKYTLLADKYEVRKFVSNRINSSILNDLYGIYSNVDEINIDELPESFVLKATHGSGWNVFCLNKNTFNWNLYRKKIYKWLHSNYYSYGREWVYKNIQPRIVCEKLLKEKDGKCPIDYKFYCFNGRVKYIQIDVDRFTNHTRCFYNTLWEKQPFTTCYLLYKGEILKPDNLSEMITISEKLSSGIPFVRIDLYSFNKQILFGEMTFYPENGFGRFYPNTFDKYLGMDLELNMVTN